MYKNLIDDPLKNFLTEPWIISTPSPSYLELQNMAMCKLYDQKAGSGVEWECEWLSDPARRAWDMPLTLNTEYYYSNI